MIAERWRELVVDMNIHIYPIVLSELAFQICQRCTVEDSRTTVRSGGMGKIGRKIYILRHETSETNLFSFGRDERDDPMSRSTCCDRALATSLVGMRLICLGTVFSSAGWTILVRLAG